jgi:cyclopropane fatty-acyl-phospholipid synthase-like methyltransferase
VGSPWREWYREKGDTVEPEMLKLEELFKRAGVRRILDLGCGAGRHVVYFARKGFELYGFDQSQEAIEQTRLALTHENLQANLKAWNMVAPLPYRTRFFDAILAVRVIHHTYTKNIERIFGEIDRVLRNGGFLFAQVPSYETEIRDRPDDSGTQWVEPGTLIPRSGPLYERGVPHHFFSREELVRMLSGYEILEIHTGSDHYRGYCIIAHKPKDIRYVRDDSSS